jgi:hypothetical protein
MTSVNSQPMVPFAWLETSKGCWSAKTTIQLKQAFNSKVIEAIVWLDQIDN